MDRSGKKSRRENKRPRVPIKTYRWEDVRRSRKRGGYPWTYLYKPPFDEELDTESYTMEGMRKAHSSSTMAKYSDMDISEVSDFDTSVASGDMPQGPQIVTEPPEDHSKVDSPDSVVIEECEERATGGGLEPAESWDNISQYLDKEERDASLEKKESPIPEAETTIPPITDQTKPDQRKRKLSAESSYSRISQTKSAILKKINDAKNKIKVPKLSFPTSKLKAKKPAAKKKPSPPEVKKETKPSTSQHQKNSKPVYIYIPLKPPAGQTDEFSHFEFDTKVETKEKPKKPGSFRDLVKQIKQAQEEAQPKLTDQPITEEKSEEVEENKENLKPLEENEKTKPIFEEKTKSEKENDQATDTKLSEPSIQEEMDTISPPSDTKIFEKCENYSQSPTEIEETDERPITTEGEEEYKGEDIFDHLFKASSSKQEQEQEQSEQPTDQRIRSKSAEPEGRRRKPSLESSYSRKSLSKLNFIKKLKDASSKIKSSLSKTGSKKKKPEKEAKKEEDPKPEVKKIKSLKPQKNVEPVYIHIPLKPPEGKPDEFSHLASEEKPPERPEEGTSTSPDSPDTPDTPVRKEGVQFIILTAPSDDEILDYNSSDVPETPSSETKPFFTCKITELKELAKEVADGVEGKKLDSVEEESSNGKEENGEGVKATTPTEKESSEVKVVEGEKMEVTEMGGEIVEISKKVEEVMEQVEINKVKDKKVKENVIQSKKPSKSAKGDEAPNNVVVDEEDGLNETVKENLSPDMAENAEEDRATQELKSSLKGGGGSPPVMKKKVSFKRRSRSSKDGSYEDIQAPSSEVTVKKAEAEDQVVLEGKVEDVAASVIDRVMKERAMEDDKWSKMSDHEYEPVNPPPDNVEPPVNLPPTVYIVDTDYDKGILPIGTISFEPPAPPEPKPKEETKVQSEPQVVGFTPKNTTSSGSSEKPKEGPSRFQLALKQQTDNFKNKLHNIKRPHISLPERPKFNKPDFKKFKIHKPKINLPKIPDTARINLPNFSLHSRKRSLNQRQLSTESQDGDSKKPIFDFTTYPRRFKDKFKSKPSQDSPQFATVPRTKKQEPKQEASSRWSGSESIRIPLHSEDSTDLDDKVRVDEEFNEQEEKFSARSDENPSHVRYGEDIDIDDDYERENNELNQERDYMNRWNQGRFNEDFNEEYLQNLKNSKYKVTDLDSPEDNPNIGYDFNNSGNRERDRDRYSSGSSFGHRRGVIEEINSDEFFWRPKGISQDDINVSMNISSEIREAFRTPANALAQIENIQDQNSNLDGSHQSLPEATGKRKPIKKPKRKKTPHTSQEKIQRQEESLDEDQEVSPPSRPKRRSKRKKKDRYSDDVIPYRETISVDITPADDRFNEHRESLGVLGDDEQDEELLMYENEKMEGKEQPKIGVTDPYTNFEFADEDEPLIEKPAAPRRKQKSLKSLNTSENDFAVGDFGSNGGFSAESILARERIDPEIEAIRTGSKVIIPIQTEAPPKRPSRTRSRTNSQSRGTSQVDEDSLRAESLAGIDFEENEARAPCVEEPCVQDIRDCMGYAIVDKSKARDPPLPPPRIPNRQKRGAPKAGAEQFNTVPRAGSERTPIRPLRNYSTLGQAKKTYNAYENKENIDITQYIEIDDEPSKDLQSGEVIQKMKDRPLPAPPRPPRKSRLFKDITSKENIMQETNDEPLKTPFDEIEVSTQTEPLPDDFVCEELVQEPSDRIMMPSASAEHKPKDTIRVERRLITPTYYTHEETVTHGSLLVEPLNGAQLLPDSELSKERIVPITMEADDETSSIPEEFTKLSDPPKKPSSENRRATAPAETEILKAHKLKVTDLDVEKLTVNQLLANKIIVSEIDSSNIQTNEISSKSGTLRVGEINLPPEMIDQIIRTIRSSQSDAEEAGQKKTSIEARDSDLEEFLESPMKSISLESFEKEIIAKYSEAPNSNVGKRESQQDVSEQILPGHQVELDRNIEEQILISELVDVTVEPKLDSEFPEDNLEEPLSESEILSEVAKEVKIPLSETPEVDRDVQQEILEESLKVVDEILEESLKVVEEVRKIPVDTPKVSSKLETSEVFLETEDQAGSLDGLVPEPAEKEPEASVDASCPPQPPPRASAHREELDRPPVRPPRQEKSHSGSLSYQEDSLQEPEVDDEPPPRPPEPLVDYFPSQPPASFYALKAQKYVDDNIPVVPRRRRRTRSRPRTRSSSEDSSPVARRFHRRSSEGSIAQLSGQLARACGTEINNSLKRLICYITNNVFGNSDGKQDLNVMILIVLVLIAGLILLGYGEEKTVVHLHHWEYFNPPRDF